MRPIQCWKRNLEYSSRSGANFSRCRRIHASKSIQMGKKTSRIVSMDFSRVTFRVVPVLAGSLLLLGAAQVRAQQNSQGPPPNASSTNESSKTGQSQSAQRPSSQKKTEQQAAKKASPAAPAQSNPAVSNPFPMAQSEAAAKADGQQDAQEPSQPQQDGALPSNPGSSNSGSSNAAASNPKRTHGQSSPAQDNPFPEAQSKAAAKAEGDQGSAGGSGTSQAGSSSSKGGYSSSNLHLPAPELGEGNLGTHRKLDTFTRDQTPGGRVEDDLNVADFYMKNGNYRGGYMRYQDALEFDPQNDTALYGIAEALCKENLTSEAMAHFKSYVTNNPQGKYARKAEKMLDRPEKCMHNR